MTPRRITDGFFLFHEQPKRSGTTGVYKRSSPRRRAFLFNQESDWLSGE
jgi:hypothetical protein